ASGDRDRIFEPFVQAAVAAESKGTGLGLSITRRLVQALGGTIQVHSELGRGSQFHVELPVQIADTSDSLAEALQQDNVISLAAGQPQYRVLIVEDQRQNWLLLERLLRTAGLQVRIAQDGGPAIQISSDWHPHFIWMDVRLKTISG